MKDELFMKDAAVHLDGLVENYLANEPHWSIFEIPIGYQFLSVKVEPVDKLIAINCKLFLSREQAIELSGKIVEKFKSNNKF